MTVFFAACDKTDLVSNYIYFGLEGVISQFFKKFPKIKKVRLSQCCFLCFVFSTKQLTKVDLERVAVSLIFFFVLF